MTDARPAQQTREGDMLLIDAGSSRLKWLFARGDQLLPETAGSSSVEEFKENMAQLPRPSAVVICSVMGAGKTAVLVSACKQNWGTQVITLASEATTLGVHNAYEKPAQMGSDRWAAIVAAVQEHDAPIVIIDVGTATTIDAVDQHGQHLGGLIFPGPALMASALRTATGLGQVVDEQRLRERDDCGRDNHDTADAMADAMARDRPTNRVGHGVQAGFNSVQAIENGIMAAQLGALAEYRRSLGTALLANPKLVLTGGGCADIMPQLEAALPDQEIVFDRWLVFRGILLMALQKLMDDSECSEFS